MRQIALLALSILLRSTLSGAEETPTAGTLRVGKNLHYTRGTARAKEQLLEFPYKHTNSSRECWAYVVHEGQGVRVIFKKDEVEGNKDESGDLVNEDFDMDHPFMKVLDQIKLDALLNVYKELQKTKKIDEENWQVLSGDSAVHKLYFKNSQARYYCIVAVHDPTTKKISQPILLSFQRSKQGPMATLLSPQGTFASAPQPVGPTINNGTHQVFKYLESRKGF